MHYPVWGLNDRKVIIGLMRSDNGVWKWVDGTDFSLDRNQLAWKPGKPVDHLGGLERCAYMSINTQQVDNVHCDLRGVMELILARYVCERTLGR